MSATFPNFFNNPQVNLTAGSGAQRPSSISIDSGFQTGNVFDGRGTDFLDPDDLGGNVTDFSGTIRPVGSNTLIGRLFNPAVFGRHPDPLAILRGTNGVINNVNGAGFGSNLLGFQPPIFNHPFFQPVPDLGVNPDPVRVTLSTLFFAQNISAPASINDPRNFNPLVWNNPTAGNILLGTTGSIGTILSGGSLSFPSFNPFPTQAAVNFPANPFGGASSLFGSPVPNVPNSVTGGFNVPFTPAPNPGQPADAMMLVLGNTLNHLSHTIRQLVGQGTRPATGQAGSASP